MIHAPVEAPGGARKSFGYFRDYSEIRRNFWLLYICLRLLLHRVKLVNRTKVWLHSSFRKFVSEKISEDRDCSELGSE